MHTLQVVPRFKVRGDWCDWQVQGKRPTPATMNQHGAVCGKATNGKMLGLKPGEFDFVCPYFSGKTELVDHKWVIDPEEEQRLWVRESWRTSKSLDHVSPRNIGPGAPLDFIADGWNEGFGPIPYERGKNRPSIFMPRWASRINLEITGVKIERLRDISEEDAENEGVYFLRNYPDADESLSASKLFMCLWDSINGKPRKGGIDISWAANPFVWALKFKQKN